MHTDGTGHDINEAIAEAITAIGGYKQVAGELWPSLKIGSAYTRLKNALREDRDEKLSPDEVIVIGRLARHAGCHAIAQYYCHAMDYEPPVTREPEDEQSMLRRQFIESVQVQQQLIERMEALNSSVTQLRTHPRRGAA